MNLGADNQTSMLPCIMGGHEPNGTIMPCMTIQIVSSNETMMPCTTDQNDIPQTGPECTRFWLQQAILLHNLHMMVPNTMTEESNMKLMDQMKQAYECATGENVTQNTTTGIQNASKAEDSQDCTTNPLRKAMEIHDMHMKDPEASDNESSQMELMHEMIRAYDCIPVNKTTMVMCQKASISQARIHCADFWLQKATEIMKYTSGIL